MSDDTRLTLTSSFTELPECMPAVFSWDGGVPPYKLYFFYLYESIMKIEDIKLTNHTTSIPFPAGTEVFSSLMDSQGREVEIKFTIIQAGGHKDCLPSNEGIEVPNPADVQQYSRAAGDAPRPWQLKANGLGRYMKRKWDLRLSSCSLIEVDLLNVTDRYCLSLWPQSEKPVPYLLYCSDKNITFPLPYPPGVVFKVRISDGEGWQESDSILALSGGTESCILGPVTSTISPASQLEAVAYSNDAPAASTIGRCPPVASATLVAFLVTMLLVTAFCQYRKRQPKVFLAEEGDAIPYDQTNSSVLPTFQACDKVMGGGC